MKQLLFCLLLTFFFFSCDSGQKEAQWKERLSALKQKEDSLVQKQKSLDMKEQELAIREMRLDSVLKHVDTQGVYNPALTGIWKIKMTCTETSCTGSAVGDVRTEQWEVKYQDYTVMAYALRDEKIVRTYAGIFKQDKLMLTAQKQQENEATITAELGLISNNKMEGRREIVQLDGCKIVYTLEATRP